MQISIRHETTYEFDQPVPYALQRLRLKPKHSAGQEILDWGMEIEGGVIETEFEDHHFNDVLLVRTLENVERLTIICQGTVTTDNDYSGVIGRHRGYVPLWMFRRETELTKPGKAIRKMIKTIAKGDFENDIEMLHALSAHILDQVSYENGTTHASTTAEEAAHNRSGVCQDHAHIFISAARALGFPARYVSGYLYMPDRVEQEAGHAWAEACVDGLGWVGFDISNGISPDEKYVRVATGFDYSDAAPVTAMSFGARDRSLNVSLQIMQGVQQ